jgi:hypothetical protein
VTTADILREQGRTKGQRATLLKLLTQRFGVLSDDVVARVTEAEPPVVDAWFDRVLTAATLTELLGEG